MYWLRLWEIETQNCLNNEKKDFRAAYMESLTVEGHVWNYKRFRDVKCLKFSKCSLPLLHNYC